MQLDKQLDAIPGANVNWQKMKCLNKLVWRWIKIHQFIEYYSEQEEEREWEQEQYEDEEEQINWKQAVKRRTTTRESVAREEIDEKKRLVR